MSIPDPADELRRLYPPILTTAHVAEMMHCTIGDVRDKVHRGELEALRWGQQFRFFREEVIASMTRYRPGDPTSGRRERTGRRRSGLIGMGERIDYGRPIAYQRTDHPGPGRLRYVRLCSTAVDLVRARRGLVFLSWLKRQA